MAERSREHWAERSKIWAATTPRGKSEDDTLNQMIIEEAAIGPGETVLDVASGTGDPALSMALFMTGKGAGTGSVTCADLTPHMLEAARRRARNLDLTNMGFAAADMTALPFVEASFDCVTCRLGLMHTTEKAGAAAEAWRVLRPGGRAAYVVWGAYEDNPRFHVPRRAVAAFFNEPEETGAARHSLSRPGTVKGILDAAGFEGTRERELGYSRPVKEVENYVASGLKRSFAKKLKGLAGPEFEALKQAVLAAWQPYIEDATLTVPYSARLGIGWKGA